MKILFSVIRHLMTLPVDLIGWPLVLVIHLMWGRRLFWYKGALFTVLKEDSWPRNSDKFAGGWYKNWGGTTLTAHAIMLSEPGMNTKTVEHELQHTRQMVAASFAFLLIALAVTPWITWGSLLIWALGSTISVVSAYFEAWTNSGSAYEDNIQEQHARAASANAPYQLMDDILDGKIEPLDWTPQL